MSSSELVNGKENKSIKDEEREIIDLDKKIEEATVNGSSKLKTNDNNATLNDDTNENSTLISKNSSITNNKSNALTNNDIDDLKNNFKKILSKSNNKQNNKNNFCSVKSMIEDLNQKNEEVYSRTNESNNVNEKVINDYNEENIIDHKLPNDFNYKNEISNINKKLDSLCMKMNEERIKYDMENKAKFKKLLDTVSSHLNVQLVNAVENTIKREVKSGILQLKKTVGESVLSLENKSTAIINEISQTKMDLPENIAVLETIKKTMIDVFLPVIESCIEEMKSQIMVEIKNSICMPENNTKTISIKDEIVSLLNNENINDACVLALDCVDDLLPVFVDNCSMNLLERLDSSLQGLLLKKSVSLFSEFENEKIVNFICNVLMIFEIQDLSLDDLVELQNILEFLNTVDTNENMKLIIKMQGNQIRKLIVKKRR